jgi:hypothetical protein
MPRKYHLSANEKRILDERIAENGKDYISAEESVSKLKAAFLLNTNLHHPAQPSGQNPTGSVK